MTNRWGNNETVTGFIFFGRNGETGIENRLTDMGRREERVRC